MARLHVLDSDPRAARRWAAGRAAGVLGLIALLAALVAVPDIALRTLWNIAVPILPLTFFLTPALWRGVCPLSTVNAWGNHLGRPREMTAREAAVAGAAGLVLFHVIVPARHLGLNTDGPLLAIALTGIAVLAVASGAVFASRSAFCNALCPVLPVERLYGQAPVFDLQRGRCDTCAVCTPRGCIDLADRKALRQVIGAARHGQQWLATPFGVFAAALPGFIVGYFLTPDLPLAAAGRVYGATLGGAALSYAAVRAIATALSAPPLRTATVLAALSGGLYYWFAAASITATFGLPPVTATVLRVAALAGLLAWLAATLRHDADPA